MLFLMLVSPAMEMLLAQNEKAALIGDITGKVRPEHRLAGQSPLGWYRFLKSEYQEPPRVDKNMTFIKSEGSKELVPIATYSDAEYNLSVRAAFDRHNQVWFVADL